MRAYCSDGQLRRFWPIVSTDVDYDVLAPIREQVADEIDAALGCVFYVPFNAYVRVLAVDTNDVTVSHEDIGYFTAADTVGYYDNSEKQMATETTTISSIAGNVLSLADAGSIAVGDELGVVTAASLPTGNTTNVVGPPPEVRQMALAMARYYAHLAIRDTEAVPEGMQVQYDRALAWLERCVEGKVAIGTATARVPGFISTEDYTPAFGPDDPEDWDTDPDQLDELADERSA